jgi:hypothetical protein
MKNEGYDRYLFWGLDDASDMEPDKRGQGS